MLESVFALCSDAFYKKICDDTGFVRVIIIGRRRMTTLLHQNEEIIKTLHGCLLDVSLEIKRICEKYHISYFLIAGSLLGCVRHGGIIPWDDDVDIGMLREDYELFLEKCEGELRSPFKLVNSSKEKNYGLPYSKIKIEGTEFREPFSPDDLDKGIFVDIFPIDRMPDKRFPQQMQKIMLKIFGKLMILKCGYKIEGNDRILVKGLRIISRFMPKNRLDEIIHFWQTKHNHDKTKYFLELSGAYPYGKEVYPSPVMERKQFVLHQFEGYEFAIPVNAEELLTSLYGDYMKLPPENQRVFKHADGISFGSYRPYSIH